MHNSKNATVLEVISQALDRGDIEESATLLFNPANQSAYTTEPRFWYAQVLTAALQDKGFHLAFLTAYEARASQYSKTLGDKKIITVEAMIAFIEPYRDNPAFASYRQKIEALIAFYKNGIYQDPFKETLRTFEASN